MIQDKELLEAASASFREAEDSSKAQALRGEWWAMAETRRMSPGLVYDSRRHSDGRPVFIVRCNNGYHESLVGYEDALEKLVDSHRTRLEDTPEVHTRLQGMTGFGLKDSRNMAREMSRTLRKQHPNADGPALDALLAHALDALEDKYIEDRRVKDGKDK